MRVTTFAALSLLLSAAVAIPLGHAGAQDAPPPASEAAPPPPAQDATPPATQGATPPAPQSAPSPAGSATAAAPPTVTHSKVNLRGGPGTNYALVKLIPAGSPVEVKECKHGWCQVVFQGADGYIIESRLAPHAPGTSAKRRFTPMPGYVGPPPVHVMRLPGYYPRYYYYGPYYHAYWAWRRAYWRVW
ncbi:MAG: SH3 domain-containing protein [Hyphomicrobiales bacterium]|nr:SH3 domain-containing protein [Hyphomicrobiales bacterium]MBV9427884.1 SH3 domain-containing protein [Bradyrhizobiaceae bacterium]